MDLVRVRGMRKYLLSFSFMYYSELNYSRNTSMQSGCQTQSARTTKRTRKRIEIHEECGIR